MCLFYLYSKSNLNNESLNFELFKGIFPTKNTTFTWDKKQVNSINLNVMSFKLKQIETTFSSRFSCNVITFRIYFPFDIFCTERQLFCRPFSLSKINQSNKNLLRYLAWIQIMFNCYKSLRSKCVNKRTYNIS